MPEMLRLACEIEGHPDNAAAALLGGFVVSARDGPTASRPSGSIRRATCAPSCSSRSCACRPTRCGPRCRPPSRSTTRWPTSGRSRSGSPGLATGRYDLLAQLTVDRLHEPYRAAVYPQLPRMVEAARTAGALGACLSGAGSDDPRVRRLDGRHHPDRGRVLRRRGRPGPGRPGPGRRAAQRGGAHRRPRLSGRSAPDRRRSGDAAYAVRSRMNARTSFQAAALSSAKSAALRSKKLCGAPG